MGRFSQTRSWEQRDLRRRRGERAFLFDSDFTRCLGTVDREQWEFTISIHGGDVVAAARECGLAHIQPGAKAVWGRSAEEALGTYRRWRRLQAKR